MPRRIGIGVAPGPAGGRALTRCPVSLLARGRRTPRLSRELLPASPFRDETMAWLRAITSRSDDRGRVLRSDGGVSRTVWHPHLRPHSPGRQSRRWPRCCCGPSNRPPPRKRPGRTRGPPGGGGRPAPVPVGGGPAWSSRRGRGSGPPGRRGGELPQPSAGSRWALAELEQIAAASRPGSRQRPAAAGRRERPASNRRLRRRPGELAYLPMCEPLYWQLEVPRSAPSRVVGTAPRGAGRPVLAKFAADLPELLQPGQALESRVVRDQVPSGCTTPPPGSAGHRHRIHRHPGGRHRGRPDLERPVPRPVSMPTPSCRPRERSRDT